MLGKRSLPLAARWALLADGCMPALCWWASACLVRFQYSKQPWSHSSAP